MKTIQSWCLWELNLYVYWQRLYIHYHLIFAYSSFYIFVCYTLLCILYILLYCIFNIIADLSNNGELDKVVDKTEHFLYILPFNIALLIIKWSIFGPQIIFVIRNIFLEISLIFKQKKNHHDKCVRVLIRYHVIEIIWWHEDTIWPCTKSFF